MCSRFERKTTKDTLEVRFEVTSSSIDELPLDLSQDEIRPTDPVIIISQPHQAKILSWGLPASWDNKPLINARSETLTERKTFQPLLENRCLVPATAYFEWRKAGRNRFKNRIALENDEPFAFAGLFTETAFTIITCAPAGNIAGIHNRMPVILPKNAELAWLDPTQPFDTVAPLLTPYTESCLSAEEDIPPGTQQDLFA
ncbi:MAG: SOS response-associated peptidase [Rhodospirillales bacterium]|jgi:putative SOS response-associated peptidase YedK